MCEIPRHAATSSAVRGDGAPNATSQPVGSAVPASHNLYKTIIHVNLYQGPTSSSELREIAFSISAAQGCNDELAGSVTMFNVPGPWYFAHVHSP
jgi:hypothetical protein